MWKTAKEKGLFCLCCFAEEHDLLREPAKVPVYDLFSMLAAIRSTHKLLVFKNESTPGCGILHKEEDLNVPHSRARLHI